MSSYPPGHAEPVLRSHSWRTAANSAGYLLPQLRPGQRLLDVGCGPGTITVDLARYLAPGTVVGLDPAETAIAAAREAVSTTTALSPNGDLTANVELVCGSLGDYTDPEGFDVVHAHQVLQHLPDPVTALQQMAALCRPGGMIAARDADYAAFTWYPHEVALDDWLDLYHRVARSAGGQPDAGRRLLSWALQAGLHSVQSTASVWCFATPPDRQWWGGMWADRIVDSDIARRAVDQRLATTADLRRLRRGWQRWLAADDGWFLVPHGEIVARSAPA